MEDPIAIHNAPHFYSPFYERSRSVLPGHTSHIGVVHQHSSSPASSPNAYFSSTSARPPPSPPRERMHGFNLPPITDLLNISRPDHTDRSYSRRSPSSSQSHSQRASSPRQKSTPKLHSDNSPVSAPNGGSFLLPPTPPMQPTTSVPQAQVSSQLLPPPSFPVSYQPLETHHNQPELYHPRHTSLPTSVVAHRSSYPSNSPHSIGSSSLHNSPQPHHHHHHHHHHHQQHDHVAPSNQSHPRHRSMPGLVTQQPLPTDFPPHIPHQLSTPHSSISGASSTDVSATSSAHTSWQSQPHSHLSPTTPNSAGPFGTSQDRYVCPTCTKAFSRPSSLRIHSHSHTGEKPFKCPHKGCGKAFSVRSNMKRHERGCHAERALQSEAANMSASVVAAGGRELLPAT